MVDTQVNTTNTIDAIDWTHVMALDCTYEVGSSNGRFVDWLADKLARDTNSFVKHNGIIIADYRSK